VCNRTEHVVLTLTIPVLVSTVPKHRTLLPQGRISRSENDSAVPVSIHSFIFLLLPLEHGASLKRFLSLQFLNLQRVGRTPWTGDQPVRRSLPTQGNTDAEYTWRNIHASSGIRTYDPSVRAGGDSSCLRPPGHFDRHEFVYMN
jgi:hypothetical protein